MSKIFELIRPQSYYDSAYAEFEYLIRWIGKDGSDYLYIFYDAEINQVIDNDIINSLSSSNIEALIKSEKRSITLTASDLSKSDLLIITEMFANKFVTRIHKDESIERFAPLGNSFKYRLMDGRYEVEFELQMYDLAVLK